MYFRNTLRQPYKLFLRQAIRYLFFLRQAIRNLYNLLKPGGDVLMCYMASNPIYDVYISMSKTSIWKPYMMDVNKFISPYHYRQDVEESLRKTLLDVGFEISVCECKTKWHEYENMNVLISKLPSEHFKITGCLDHNHNISPLGDLGHKNIRYGTNYIRYESNNYLIQLFYFQKQWMPSIHSWVKSQKTWGNNSIATT